jgi:hypothetical protein
VHIKIREAVVLSHLTHDRSVWDTLELRLGEGDQEVGDHRCHNIEFFETTWGHAHQCEELSESF